MAYTLMFLTVIALTFIYEHSGYTKEQVIPHYILGLVIILIPSMMGGFRAVTVGSDNLNYYNTFTYLANHSFSEIFFGSYSNDTEIGALILTWLISRLGNNYCLFAFITSFITYALIFEGAKYYQSRFSMTVIIACYLFIYYCPMYNYVRQAIALAIVFYAFRYAEERKFKKYLIAVMIATTFHVSAILSLIIYFAFYLNSLEKIKKWYFVVIAVIALLLIAGPSMMVPILNKIGDLGIRTETVYKYARRFASYTQYQFVPVHMLRALPQLFIFTLYYKRITATSKEMRGYYILTWIQFFFMAIGCVFEPFSRTSLYFNYSEFILMASLIRSFSQTRWRQVSVLALSLFLIGYWYFFTVLNYYGFSYPVFPYTSVF